MAASRQPNMCSSFPDQQCLTAGPPLWVIMCNNIDTIILISLKIKINWKVMLWWKRRTHMAPWLKYSQFAVVKKVLSSKPGVEVLADYSRLLRVNKPVVLPLPPSRGDEVLLLQLQFASHIWELVAPDQSSGAPLPKHLSLVLVLQCKHVIFLLALL